MSRQRPRTRLEVPDDINTVVLRLNTNNADKALPVNPFATRLSPLYVSATFYDSGSLETSQSEVNIAGLTNVSTNASDWSEESGEGVSASDNNQVSALVTTPF